MLQLKGVQILQIVVLMITAVLVQSTNTTFQLQLTRNQGSNVITLRCRNDSGLHELGAVFYLNGSELSTENYPAFSNHDGQPGVVTFQIKRQLEGMYSCGIEGMKSSPNSLIISKYDHVCMVT